MFDENTIKGIKYEKQKVSDIIYDELQEIDAISNAGRQKKRELIDIAKFINASKENIQILKSKFKAPDFLIQWDGIKFGLEHTEVIDLKKKDTFEKTETLIKKTEKAFIEKYGNVNRQINLSLKFEVTKITKREKRKLLTKLLSDWQGSTVDPQKLMRLAYPGHLTKEDISVLAEELAIFSYNSFISAPNEISHDLIHYISFYPSSKTFFTRVVSWGVGSINDILHSTIKEKEAKIDSYRKNTNGLKQCLFLLIHGSNGYSDYSYFDDRILANRDTSFDKVVAFNFFTTEFFILK